MWYYIRTNRDYRNRIEITQINPHILSQLISNKDVKMTHVGKTVFSTNCAHRHQLPTPYLCQSILLYTQLRFRASIHLLFPITLLCTAEYRIHPSEIPSPVFQCNYIIIFPTTGHTGSPAALSHSFPFPHTVCAITMIIFTLQHDILYFLKITGHNLANKQQLVCNCLHFTRGVILSLFG